MMVPVVPAAGADVPEGTAGVCTAPRMTTADTKAAPRITTADAQVPHTVGVCNAPRSTADAKAATQMTTAGAEVPESTAGV